ncbi:MAG: FG-GAP-like repeat-containing protein [Vicinamibacterales bacterium]
MPASARAWLACVLATTAVACRGTDEPLRGAPPALVAGITAAGGQMGRYDFQAAVDQYAALARDFPDSAETSFNLAVALVNRQRQEDAAEAERRLRALTDHPRIGVRARYTLGLLLLYQGRDAEAFPLLSSVAAARPRDPYPAYFAGQARLTSAPDDALRWFDAAVAADPLLRSAQYGAFQALQRSGRADAAAGRLEAFQALERDPRARLAEFKYSRMGPLAEVVFVDGPEAPAPAPAGPPFQAPRVVQALPALPGDAAPSVTVVDLDGDGDLDLVAAGTGSQASPNLVLLAQPSGWAPAPAHPLAAVPGVRAALWGDIDNDGLVDAVLVRARGGTSLWRQTAPGQWTDITRASHAGTPEVDAVDGALFDADHDGDLDLYLVNARGPNALLNNDGNGTFRPIAAEAGVAGDGRPSIGVSVADLDGDRDHDLVILRQTPPHDVYLNDRVWRYHRAEGFEAFVQAPHDAVLAADLDANGEPELYTLSARGLERWAAGADGQRRAEMLAPPADALPAQRQLAVADVDGDGAFELLASSANGWTAYAVPAAGPATAVAAGGAAAMTWTVAALNPVKGPSVVGVTAEGLVEWPAGPGRHPYLSIATTGKSQASDQRRSNVSGIGTKVHVRTGSRWTAFDTVRLQSGPGQGLQPVLVGLGGAARADLVSLTWSDGVLQTELNLAGGRAHVIEETQRQLSSCPVLFAYDGTATRFVTDLLGVGGIGFFERPGVYSPPFPQEAVLLDSRALGPTADGRLRLHVGEPMEEVAYLDGLELVAHDVPAGWQVALDERKAIAGPAPTGAPVFFREERLPARAVNDRGEDVTAAVVEADLRAAPPGAPDPRFIGLTAPHSLELAFDRPLDDGEGQATLVVDGWVEYPYAQTVFAAWQAGVPFEAPTLEARDRHGRWHSVAPEFGYPAGMPRRMTLPLPALPPGTTALRLTTTQEVFWDRVSVAYATTPPPGTAGRALRLASATLREAGFARRTTGPQRTPSYDYDRRTPLWDTRHPRGWYTRFGDVLPLVREADDATVVLGPGEEVVVEFDAPPPLRDGWTRYYVLRARGWCKDMDLYTRDGETVAPLPGRDTPARRALQGRFATRYEGGQ